MSAMALRALSEEEPGSAAPASAPKRPWNGHNPTLGTAGHGVEYVARLQTKIQSMASELQDQAVELEQAEHYRVLCETRLRELQPSIELPLRPNESGSVVVHGKASQPSHVLSTIARYHNDFIDAEKRLEAVKQQKLAVETKSITQGKQLKHLRQVVEQREKELTSLRRRLHHVEATSEQDKKEAEEAKASLRKLEYRFQSSKGAAAARRTAQLEVMLGDGERRILSLEKEAKVKDEELADARGKLKAMREVVDEELANMRGKSDGTGEAEAVKRLMEEASELRQNLAQAHEQTEAARTEAATARADAEEARRECSKVEKEYEKELKRREDVRGEEREEEELDKSTRTERIRSVEEAAARHAEETDAILLEAEKRIVRYQEELDRVRSEASSARDQHEVACAEQHQLLDYIEELVSANKSLEADHAAMTEDAEDLRKTIELRENVRKETLSELARAIENEKIAESKLEEERSNSGVLKSKLEDAQRMLSDQEESIKAFESELKDYQLDVDSKDAHAAETLQAATERAEAAEAHADELMNAYETRLQTAEAQLSESTSKYGELEKKCLHQQQLIEKLMPKTELRAAKNEANGQRQSTRPATKVTRLQNRVPPDTPFETPGTHSAKGYSSDEQTQNQSTSSRIDALRRQLREADQRSDADRVPLRRNAPTSAVKDLTSPLQSSLRERLRTLQTKISTMPKVTASASTPQQSSGEMTPSWVAFK